VDSPGSDKATIWNTLGFWFPHIVILGYCGVIASAFMIQILGSELPCPLCMLQRMAMVLVGLAALWMIGLARKGRLDLYAYARCYGFMLAGAMIGALMSSRQIELHILPGDPGYGEAVLGLHLYTWAFVTFCIVIIYCAVMLTLARQLLPKVPQGQATVWISRIVVGIFIFIIVANIVSVFLEEGFALYLPDDPARYELLYQLGLK
jgi:disulfide bond formation protein DsbB